MAARSRLPASTLAGVRVQGLTIHDVLNDAPNTCTFVLEGDGPAVGQAVRITWSGTVALCGPGADHRPGLRGAAVSPRLAGHRDRRQRDPLAAVRDLGRHLGDDDRPGHHRDLCAGVLGRRHPGRPPARVDRLRRLRDVHRLPGAAGDRGRRLLQDRGPHRCTCSRRTRPPRPIRSTARTGFPDPADPAIPTCANCEPASTARATANRSRPTSWPARRISRSRMARSSRRWRRGDYQSDGGRRPVRHNRVCGVVRGGAGRSSGRARPRARRRPGARRRRRRRSGPA